MGYNISMNEYGANLNQLLQTLFTWDNLIQLAVIFLLYFGTDNQLVKTINWLKDKLEWSNKKAELLVIVMAVLVSVATMLVEGVLVPASFTMANFAVLVTAVTYAARSRYRRLKQKEIEAELDALKLDVESG